MKKGLTIKQEKFCSRYLECGNASEAYRYAYDCSNMSNNAVWNASSILLDNPKVTQRIKELQSEILEASKITKERILTELEAILEAKITDYLEFDGISIRFKDFNTLTDKQVRAIESIKEGKNGIELKLHGKNWTIDRICQMLGFDAPAKVDANVTMSRYKAVTSDGRIIDFDEIDKDKDVESL